MYRKFRLKIKLNSWETGDIFYILNRQLQKSLPLTGLYLFMGCVLKNIVEVEKFGREKLQDSLL